MPAFLIQMLVSLVLRFGMAWLLKRFPGIPDEVKQIVEETAGELSKHKEARRKTLRRARARVSGCVGPSCKVES